VNGVSQSQLYGLDVTETFFKLGLQLFGDKGKSSVHDMVDKFAEKQKDDLLSHFLVKSILDSDFASTVLKWKPEGFEVVFLGSFLHLFNEEQVRTVLQNCKKILKSNGILLGRNLGSVDEAGVKHRIVNGK
jgi:SAM-dependent methyltransferase